MIDSLYDCFKHWSDGGSVYIISDTHLDDSDCKLMNPNWITPEQQMYILRHTAHRNDTLIHLGDVGNPEYMKQLKCYKVLIMGNHDQSVEKFRPYFDEVYKGPLVISEKLILSHEPLGIIPVAPETKPVMFNIHGHVHNDPNPRKTYWLNVAADVASFTPINLGKAINNGLLSNVVGLNRTAINRAIKGV